MLDDATKKLITAAGIMKRQPFATIPSPRYTSTAKLARRRLGARILAARQVLGLTLAEADRLVGVKHNITGTAENGRGPVEKIEQVLVALERAVAERQAAA